MATCRTCGADWVYCEVPARDLATVRRSGKGCGFWFRRETPLLVDTLMGALTRVLQQFSEEGWPTISVAVLPGTEEHGATWATLPVDDETRDAICHSRDVLSRYKEEAGEPKEA